MSKRAKEIWKEIVGERPVDFFRSGARELLVSYCSMAATQEENIAAMNADSLNPEYQRLVRDMATTMNQTAAKLRISIQTEVDRKSGKLDEKAPTPKGQKGKDDVLFGGNVLKF